MELILLPSELFLLEKWDHNDSSDVQVKRGSIFREYVALGYEQRRVYHERYLANEEASSAATPKQRELVQSVRTTDERRIAGQLVHGYGDYRPWLRTCYASRDLSAAVDEDDLEWMTGGISYEDEYTLVSLNDAARYDFGDDWTSVFTVLPEVVEALDRHHSAEERRQELAPLAWESSGPVEDWEDESEYEVPSQIWMHHEWVTGWLWLHDPVATASGNVAFIWLDEVGRIVRKARVAPNEYQDGTGIFDRDACSESPWWYNAEVGSAFKWGNRPALVLGQPPAHEEVKSARKLPNCGSRRMLCHL